MSVAATFVERIRTFTERPSSSRTVPSTADTRPNVAPMSLQDELRLLERTAQEKGMSANELNKTRQIGDCPAQVRTRVERLHEWLAAH
jgi:hypothetical protein